MINHKSLRREFEAGYRDQKAGRQNKFHVNLQEGLAKRHVVPEDFSLAELFEEFVEDGHELRKSFNPRFGGAGVPVLEASGPVNTGNFANITGQIVYSKVMDSYNNPAFIGDQLVETIPTTLNGEKIPGVGQVGDQSGIVPEGQPYPLAGFGEEWVETPATIKRGFMVGVTKEAIFFDRTGLVLRNAGNLGEGIGINRENRILDVVTGAVTCYRRNGAAAEATYSDTGSFGDNIAGSNALVDWTDIENALLLFDALSDPNNGEPIVINPDTILVPTALLMTALRIVNATQIVYGATGSNTATTLAQSANPLQGRPMKVLSSPRVKLRTSSASTWFTGQAKRGFAYMENWPITVTQAPANSEAEFTSDIVARFKVSERGAAGVLDPRYWVKST